ncbi:LamG-like jellyroll fold domain-containing protein, partial [Kitasatospora phosalacinea]|uniref:LamG-like jellyroll fold domain-containing protein n=1 Tax=Kitasatospora phosalacinea TaxID=2065 RepID=UPI003AF1D227
MPTRFPRTARSAPLSASPGRCPWPASRIWLVATSTTTAAATSSASTAPATCCSTPAPATPPSVAPPSAIRSSSAPAGRTCATSPPSTARPETAERTCWPSTRPPACNTCTTPAALRRGRQLRAPPPACPSTPRPRASSRPWQRFLAAASPSPTRPVPSTTYTYTPGSHLRSAVLDAAPVSYWRLGEASGTTAKSEAVANQGTDNATYSAQGVTLGTAGPGAGSGATAATFNGTSGVVTLPTSLLGSSTYSGIGLWFKTTGQGVLFGYQAGAFPAASTTSPYTPALYVGTSGKLYGELWNGWVNPIASTNPVNDGQWHYALLTGAGDTQTLYLDGAAQGTRSGQIVAPGQR